MTGTEIRSTQDVVDFLTAQHEQIKQLLDQVLDESGKAREGAFYQVRRLLAVHETAEEEIVHPRARRELTEGDVIVNTRLREERQAKEELGALERLDVHSAEFIEGFATLRAHVLAHAEQEERYEFPRLRDELDDKQLERMVTVVRMAESIAPTRAHPAIEFVGEHLLAGPFASMLDRARDAIARPGR